ncbi:MAG: UDP-N-acetylmuramate dehydrogenase [Actinomycetota bacterium]|nr:UDP-N-acetylmuramate dehydrogenase [Actinomycetota bacterium]
MNAPVLDHPQLDHDVPLAPMTTYKLGGSAAAFFDATDETTLRTVLGSVAPEVPIFVLGRGSNVVFSDAGYPGLVVRLGGDFLAVDIEEAGQMVAGGAVPLPRLARIAAEAGRGGLEFYVGIPGSVGGAVRMNAGGHGSDTREWLIAARVLDIRTGEVSLRDPVSLDLSYRHSDLSDDDLVLQARYRTVSRPRREADETIRAITRWRREHQPGGTLNAGSVFKNPPDDSAGRVIDETGLKGYRRGGISVSTMHANFFVAGDDATAQDVWDLVWAVRKRVGEETGIWLEPELRFAGPFRRSADELGRSGGSR